MRLRFSSPLAWRRDRVFLVMLLAAIALRVMVTVALRPGLELYGDSYSYLNNARHLLPYWFHPIGYPAFLRLLLWMQYTVVVPIVQHALGLAVGATTYLLLRRGGVRPWLAAIASAPVLLDAYELDVEQFLLSDTLFLALLVLAIALLLAPERPSALLATGAGLALAAATLTRGVGGAVLLPLLVYMLVRRVGWRSITALGAATLIPVIAYMGAFHVRYHQFALETTDGLWLYGHTATFARCDRLPVAQRPICPSTPIAQRVSSEWYTWSHLSPLYKHYKSDQRPVAGRRFAIAVIETQPLDYLKTTATSLGRDFEPLRRNASWAWPVDAWRMSSELHPNRTNVERAAPRLFAARLRVAYPYPPTMKTTSAARALGYYQDVVYAWGPTLLVGLVLPVVAVSMRRTRRQREAAVAATLGAAGAILLLVPCLTVTQDYRYVLVAQALLWPAGALAASALWSRPRAGRAVEGEVAPAVAEV